MEITAEPTVQLRLDIPKSDHDKLTHFQLRLSARKKKRITQEQAFSELLRKVK